MVYIIYGTTGELIKVMPLIIELHKKKQCYTIAFVQQEEQLKKFFESYPSVPKPDLWLVNGHRGKDLSKMHHIPIWLIKSFKEFYKHKKKIRAQGSDKDIVLVHGDTITTVFGAYVARRLKLELGHIEAGLRSFKLLHPFPEEIDRRIVSRYSKINFAPGEIPAQNLLKAKAKGVLVNTGRNTVYDSIQLARKMKPAVEIKDLPKHYGIVSIHRNELLANKKVFIQTLKTLAEYSKKTPLVFLQHPVTLARIKDLGIEDLLKDNFIYVPKLDYFSFIKLLDGAEFSVTDSGGLQEESTYINKPCLVHRKATERREGLDEGVVILSYYKDEVLREFLDNPYKHISKTNEKINSPTKVIVEYLKNEGYVN